MKKYTPEEKQQALEMMRNMGTRYTSKTLKITDTTLYRWRREAELQPLLSPSAQGEESGAELPTQPEDEENCEEEHSTAEAIRSSALDEAVATIAFLTQENARLMQIIKNLRSVIRGLAEVV